MELTLTAGCWVKFYMYLVKVICLYNYYSLFIALRRLTPSTPPAIPLYSK